MTSLVLLFNPDKLKAKLADSGLSKHEVARRLANSRAPVAVNNYRNRITWWMNGRVAPQPNTVRRLAAALECKVSDLCDEVDL